RTRPAFENFLDAPAGEGGPGPGGHARALTLLRVRRSRYGDATVGHGGHIAKGWIRPGTSRRLRMPEKGHEVTRHSGAPPAGPRAGRGAPGPWSAGAGPAAGLRRDRRFDQAGDVQACPFGRIRTFGEDRSGRRDAGMARQQVRLTRPVRRLLGFVCALVLVD